MKKQIQKSIKKLEGYQSELYSDSHDAREKAGIQLGIDELERLLNQIKEPKKQYFLFGEHACMWYNDESPRLFEMGAGEFGLLEITEGESFTKLADAMNGWHDYAEIGKSTYEKMKKINGE